MTHCHVVEQAKPAQRDKPPGARVIRVAIVGNPNTGKTTLLNQLVGAHFSVGNWPGVTVERKEGSTRFGDWLIHFTDLPGIYTLAPSRDSEDERVALSYLSNQRPDVILQVIDTPQLDRNLPLTVELSELGVPMVIALNMADEAQRNGVSVNCAQLHELTNIRATPTNGRTGQGVRDLLPLIVQTYLEQARPNPPRYSDALDVAQERDESRLQFSQALLEARIAIAEELARAVLKQRPARVSGVSTAIDSLVLHPVLGIVIWLGLMYAFFKLSFDFSAPYMDWLDGFINNFLGPLAGIALGSLKAPEILRQFVAEAVFGGVGFVLTFVPLIAVMFFLLTLLNMSGYMARLPFLLDRLMHHLGLNGRAVIPLLLGLGCNVPAIMATRTMGSRHEKLILIAMIPFMSCPARLVVSSFFAVLFFPHYASLVIMGMYVLGVAIALLTALLLSRGVFKRVTPSLIMELPPYRIPHLRTVSVIVWSYVREFLYRAGTLIFAVSVAIWFLLRFPFGASPEQSAVAHVGRAITPIFAPLGLEDWRISTSLIPAFLAREVALSFMSTIYAAEADSMLDEKTEGEFDIATNAYSQLQALGEAVILSFRNLASFTIVTLEVGQDNTENNLRSVIREHFTPASALAFMTLLLLYNSCLGVFGVMAKEAGRNFAVGFLAYSFVLGWLVALLVYQVGSRLPL
ncbi:MAG: ferrous iron transport protein B [Thermoflexales bacterium]